MPLGRVQSVTNFPPCAQELNLLNLSFIRCPPAIPADELEPQASCAFGGTAGLSLYLPRCCASESELPFLMEGFTHA